MNVTEYMNTLAMKDLFRLLFLISFQFCNYNSLVVVDGDVEEYYWKRYLGKIPEDAFPGGLDQNDSVTYIGQTFYEGSTIPGEIHSNSEVMYFEMNGPHSTTENIKILCTRYPELFVWTPVNEKNYKFLWNKHIVQGGYYHNSSMPFLIGRISHKNKQLVVAAVIATALEVQIHYTAEGVAHHVKNRMELLSFNEKLRWKTYPENWKMPLKASSVQSDL